ncbi:MAG TPA: alkaline phosphatase [Bacteroidales bacterium]|nr:alkaline phosphatase [Bacteroidales bacterium]
MPDNIILLIGDGMGLSQIQAGLTANFGQLNLLEFKSIGFSRTQSASDYVTDSGAGATAISTGHKTYNGAIGVDADSLPVKTILEYAEEKGLSTGLISTSAITHATPASFIAHNIDRNDYEGIALDFLKTDIDVFIGGGIAHFTARKDNRNLAKELSEKGYLVTYSMDTVRRTTTGKLIGLTAREHNPGIIEGRDDMLPVSVNTALKILSKNRKGFFLMVEGSQIDWGAHANNTGFVAMEVIDFDKAIGNALTFAKNYGNTLVIVTADHETGGMAITNGDFIEGKVSAVFATKNHTGLMVPVFAYGPGAERFQSIQQNTDLFKKMMQLLDLNPGTGK